MIKYLACLHCRMQRKEHMPDGKCLFDTKTFRAWSMSTGNIKVEEPPGSIAWACANCTEINITIEGHPDQECVGCFCPNRIMQRPMVKTMSVDVQHKPESNEVDIAFGDLDPKNPKSLGVWKIKFGKP